MSVTSVAEPMTDIDLDRLSIDTIRALSIDATCAKELLGK